MKDQKKKKEVTPGVEPGCVGCLLHAVCHLVPPVVQRAGDKPDGRQCQCELEATILCKKCT